jgi:hypothetical protein
MMCLVMAVLEVNRMAHENEVLLRAVNILVAENAE